MTRVFASAALLAAVTLGCAGCNVVTTKGADGGEDVKVSTPLGGVHVKADNSTDATELGLPMYPGAVQVKNGNGKNDSGSADISMGFAGFAMRIKVVSYGTDDSADKVEAFYKKALRNYGDVVECRNERPVGKPEKTADGLGCSDHGDDNLNNINISEDTTFKAGSKNHQRIVAVDPNGADGKKTKFALVELELPNIPSSDKDAN